MPCCCGRAATNKSNGTVPKGSRLPLATWDDSSAANRHDASRRLGDLDRQGGVSPVGEQVTGTNVTGKNNSTVSVEKRPTMPFRLIHASFVFPLRKQGKFDPLSPFALLCAPNNDANDISMIFQNR